MISRRVWLASAAGAAWAQEYQEPIGEPGSEYGERLELAGNANIGAAMDAVVQGRWLYVAGGGKLTVLDVASPSSPVRAGQVEGLGNTRQVEVQNGIAYVTSREDGLFLIDVGTPARPVLRFHYDTIELATGIAVAGPLAAVACRHAGVEFIDVATPGKPEHLSTIRVGEAQSVALYRGYAYAGVWATRELVIIDVRDPRAPKIAGKAGLVGYGDGVTVRGKLAYVATGHHSGKSNSPKPGDEHFGRGHGLEIFDVSNPGAPRFLSRVQFPMSYRVYMDMWGVDLAGDYAFVADTFNGCFVVDVRNPRKPRIVAHRQLPRVRRQAGEEPSPVAGLAVGRGVVYLAGAYTDLHIGAARRYATPSSREKPSGFAISTARPEASREGVRRYDAGGQVHAVMPNRGVLYVAAGSAGVQVVSPSLEKIASYRTEGFACDVTCVGSRVLVAEARGGLSVWQADEPGRLRFLFRYQPATRRAVRQAVPAAGGRFALLATGSAQLEIVELLASGAKLAFSQEHHGLFYKRPIAPGSPEDERVLVQWHRTGLYLYEAPREGNPRLVEHVYPHPLYALAGAVRISGKWLITSAGKYAIVEPGDRRSVAQVGLIGADGHDLTGKPTLSGSTLFTSNPYTGAAVAVEISDVRRPRFLASIALPEHNGFIQAVGDVAYIPAGYHGLVAWNFRS